MYKARVLDKTGILCGGGGNPCMRYAKGDFICQKVLFGW